MLVTDWLIFSNTCFCDDKFQTYSYIYEPRVKSSTKSQPGYMTFQSGFIVLIKA